MTGRRVLVALLVIVALAAAVLSFTALYELAVLCGFIPQLAWLLPVVIDAGAAAGSLVWLGRWAPAPARRFARVLALLLLAGSVAGNALGHGLAAFAVAAPWWVVVLVSAVAPAVLGAVVHLAVLASGREPVLVVEDEWAAVVQQRDELVRTEVDRGPLADSLGAGEGSSTTRHIELDEEADRRTVPSVDGPPDDPADRSARRTDGELLIELRALAGRTGGRPTERAVRTALRVGPVRARRLLAQLGPQRAAS